MDSNSVKEDLRRVALAAAGAVGLAADEAKKIMDRLVARGEIAEKDARIIVRKISRGDAAQKVTKAAKSAVKAADRGIGAVLDRLRLPTRSDIDALQKKIEELSAKLEKLGEKK